MGTNLREELRQLSPEMQAYITMLEEGMSESYYHALFLIGNVF